MKITFLDQTLVTHTCNPSYLGGSNQEDHSLKPAWANSSRDPISKIQHKKELAEWLKWWSASLASLKP
jgi:hypothetical protein